MGQYPWGTRRENEQTPMYLGRVLENYLGLRGMAVRARQGHFDDFFAPPEVADGMELMHLAHELIEKGRNLHVMSPQYRRITTVLEAVKDGEFDATKEESERWAASKDGQETMRMLFDEAAKMNKEETG